MRREAGFSMIETLIAAGILLIIALGLIPLFARAISDNATGADSTQASNHGKTQLEDFIQLPFNHQNLTIAGGATSLQTAESWALGSSGIGDANEGWWPGVPTGRGTILWTRRTQVQQFSVEDALDGRLDAPLAGNAQPIFVHLKQVDVVLDSAKQGGLLGSGPDVTFRVLKPF
jgi:type II secretory pathway pseudopilin PulG